MTSGANYLQAGTNPDAGESGLRERQKQARTDRILDAAGELFNTQGFDETTMAAIAGRADVSTPTVFNYFKSKDELLLARVLRLHHETRQSVRAFQPVASATLVDPACEFLLMYTRQSLEAISRKTWRHVESTRIRMPGSDFVKRYDALSDEMLQDFQHFLGRLVETGRSLSTGDLDVVAAIVFNHWSALFIELIRDEAMALDDHAARLHEDLGVLLGALRVTD